MTIDLPRTMEDQLRDLAMRQGRELAALVEDALRTYVEATAISDLRPEDVAEAQVALIGELHGVPAWRDDAP